MNGRYLRESDFPAVRRVMGPHRDGLDDDAVEDLLGDLFPDAAPGEVEDFMGTLQSFTRQATPVVQRALPGVMSGAAQGAAIGGPWGALIGAAGGAAGSLLGGKGTTPSAPSPVSPAAPGPVPLPTPALATPGVPAPPTAPTGVAANASAQLLALLSRPETMQALLALMLAGSGRATVQVGEKAVPAAAFANAIAETAALVAESATARDDAPTEYLYDAAGEPRGDLADPGARAALLLEDLGAVAAGEAWDEAEESAHDVMGAEAFAEGGLDPIASYEAALRGGVAHGY
jgi:hypothetical protein